MASICCAKWTKTRKKTTRKPSCRMLKKKRKKYYNQLFYRVCATLHASSATFAQSVKHKMLTVMMATVPMQIKQYIIQVIKAREIPPKRAYSRWFPLSIASSNPHTVVLYSRSSFLFIHKYKNTSFIRVVVVAMVVYSAIIQ